jgi:hypothetical protein
MTNETFNPSEHLIDIQGKQYLPVAWRIAWLRDVHPDARIKTELVSHTPDEAVFRADVQIISANGVQLKGRATGYGAETKGDFGDYLEKAETKALGRALAALGFGTQFCADFDEGGAVTDAPIERNTTDQFSEESRGERAMTSKKEGECYECRLPITVGMAIWYNFSTYIARHQKCPAASGDPIKAETQRVMSGVVEPGGVARPATDYAADNDPGPQEPNE